MTQPANTKPSNIRPNSAEGSARDYRKLPATEKRAVAISRQRPPSIECPGCGVGLMPSDLLAHLVERCVEELPPPHPAARWLDRVAAMRLAPSSRLDAWVASGVVRRRADGHVLELDLALAVAWARRLEVL